MRLLFSGLIITGIAAFLAVSSLHRLPPPRALPRPSIVIKTTDNLPRAVAPVCIINDFETAKDRNNFFRGYETPGGIKSRLSDAHAVHGTSSLKVVWREKRWGQLAITHFPQGWDEYKILAFEIYNSGKPFTMEVRVGEWYNRNTFDPNLSRFVQALPIAPGANSVRIQVEDIGRKIRLDARRKIIHVSIIDEKKEPQLFYIDYMRLER